MVLLLPSRGLSHWGEPGGGGETPYERSGFFNHFSRAKKSTKNANKTRTPGRGYSQTLSAPPGNDNSKKGLFVIITFTTAGVRADRY